MNEGARFAGAPQFPTHDAPRVWFIVPGTSPISTALIRRLLHHGDSVFATIYPPDNDSGVEEYTEYCDFMNECAAIEDWARRLKIVEMDIKSVGDCQAAIADAVEAFGHIDIVFCCSSEALIGTIEELSQTPHTQSLVRAQFATNFFGPVNLIKCILPHLRSRNHGHLIFLTGITGHLGTPGLSAYCAAQWAIEGFCDSIAYETAPFNIRMSIVQASLEVSVLSNRIISVPPMPAYMPPENNAPLSRLLLAGLLDRLEAASRTTERYAPASLSPLNPPEIEQPSAGPDYEQEPTDLTKPADEQTTQAPPRALGANLLSPNKSTVLHAPLPSSFRSNLIAETVHAVISIGGHPNPPARHIVGVEGVIAVKEKLKTVSEELEEFFEVSAAVDL